MMSKKGKMDVIEIILQWVHSGFQNYRIVVSNWKDSVGHKKCGLNSTNLEHLENQLEVKEL